jgi:hypothetical protein
MSDPEFKKRTDDHWSYVRGVLETADVPENIINKIGFHYKTAMIHGYKHGVVDTKEELLRT